MAVHTYLRTDMRLRVHTDACTRTATHPRRQHSAAFAASRLCTNTRTRVCAAPAGAPRPVSPPLTAPGARRGEESVGAALCCANKRRGGLSGCWGTGRGGDMATRLHKRGGHGTRRESGSGWGHPVGASAAPACLGGGRWGVEGETEAQRNSCVR